MAGLGVRHLIVTNAAGGIRSDLAPGSIVVIEDQIDWTFTAGTMGVAGWGTGGVTYYDAKMAELARQSATALGLKLPAGVYVGVLGPSFETPAEVRVLERFGAALVGMSTVLEVRAAVLAGVRTLGLSLVTNRAAGKAKHPLSHEEVLRVGAEAEDRLSDLLEEIVVRTAADYAGVTK
jgi:purine-nucleoside phosphorylase